MYLFFSFFFFERQKMYLLVHHLSDSSLNFDPSINNLVISTNKKRTTHLAVEQKTVVVTCKPTGDMLDIKLKLVEHLRHDQEAVDFLPLSKFNGNFIVDDSYVNLGVLGFPLEPRAS